MIAAAVLVLVVLLVAPAALVPAPARRRRRDDALRIAALPTDVAVLGDTVWVASGRDDRVDRARGGRAGARRAARDRLVAAAGRRRRRLGLDRQRRRRQRHAAESAVPGDVGRRIAIGADAIDVAVGPDGAWVTNGQRGDGHPHRLRSPTACSARRSRTGEFPTALAIGANHVWVVNSGDGHGRARRPARARRRSAGGCRSGATRRTSRSASARSGSPTAATGRSRGCTPPTAARRARRSASAARPGALAITRDAVLVLDTSSGAVLRVDPKTLAAARDHADPGLPCRDCRRRGRGVGRRLAQRHGHTRALADRIELASSAGSHVVGLVAYARSEGS